MERAVVPWLGPARRYRPRHPSEAAPAYETVRYVGELGTIGAIPAVMNGVADALARAGKSSAADTIRMPMTAEKIWKALG